MKKKEHFQKLFLEIAGFIIEIRFHKTEWPLVREKIKTWVVQYYNNFLIQPKKIKSHFLLDFVENNEINLFRDKKKDFFIHFFKEIKENNILTFYFIGFFELQFILGRAIEKLLSESGGFILHASANRTVKGVMVFMGESNQGKSTITRLLNKHYPSLADDTSIIRRRNGRYYFYQTPFIEKEMWIPKKSFAYPLGRMFFIEQAKENRVKKIAKPLEYLSNFSRVIQHFSLFSENEKKTKLRESLAFLASFPDIYYLSFKKDQTALVDFFRKNVS